MYEEYTMNNIVIVIGAWFYEAALNYLTVSNPFLCSTTLEMICIYVVRYVSCTSYIKLIDRHFFIDVVLKQIIELSLFGMFLK